MRTLRIDHNYVSVAGCEDCPLLRRMYDYDTDETTWICRHPDADSIRKDWLDFDFECELYKIDIDHYFMDNCPLKEKGERVGYGELEMIIERRGRDENMSREADK